jgi:ribosomal protein S12 methylthiotransferase
MRTKPSKIGLVSLGCPKNLVDSEVMLGLAREAGHRLTTDPADADVLIVNTCAFIDSAKQESIDAILEMAAHKRDGHCRRLIVTGCLAERYRDELQQQIPEIDVVLGTGEVPSIVGAIDGPTATAPERPTAQPAMFLRSRDERGVAPRPTPRVALPASPASESQSAALTADVPRRSGPAAPPTWLYNAETPRVLATPGHFAYVKVAEGCDYKCAFCIIPTLRGAYRSREPKSIVREAASLAARGVKELILISQDTTFYGVDRGDRGALARLLVGLNKVDGLRWIRLLYLYPTTIDDATLAAIAESEKVCKYVDLPLQHASDRVLKRMRRPGTRRSYERLIARIRDRVPGVTLRTTFIVGFPGETDEDVDELLGFMDQTRFDHVGVFTYSHEEGTSAYAFSNDVAQAVKQRRQRRLMSRQRQLVRAANRRRIGETVEVLVDGRSPEHDLVVKGRLMSQAPEIDPVVYLDGCDPESVRPGDFLTARLVATKDYDLVATPLASPDVA